MLSSMITSKSFASYVFDAVTAIFEQVISRTLYKNKRNSYSEPPIGTRTEVKELDLHVDT